MSVETSEVQGVASESAPKDERRAEASETRTFAKTKHEKREGRVRIAKSAAAWVMAIFYLFPVYWMVCTAFKTQKETFVYVGLLQTNPLENQLATTTLYDAFFLSAYMLIQNQPHLFFTFKPFAEQPQRRCLSKSYD